MSEKPSPCQQVGQLEKINWDKIPGLEPIRSNIMRRTVPLLVVVGVKDKRTECRFENPVEDIPMRGF